MSEVMDSLPQCGDDTTWNQHHLANQPSTPDLKIMGKKQAGGHSKLNGFSAARGDMAVLLVGYVEECGS